jgi:hypothetical protein
MSIENVKIDYLHDARNADLINYRLVDISLPDLVVKSTNLPKKNLAVEAAEQSEARNVDLLSPK